MEKTLDKIKDAQNIPATGLDRYMKEIRDIRKKGRVDTTKIQVHEITDHKNISLWTREGKRIGPLHPHNAERSFMLFHEIGTEFSATEPTSAEIEAYKATDEYKVKEKAYREKRDIKDKTRSKEGLRKILEEMAKTTGMTTEALQKIAKQGEKAAIPDGVQTSPGQNLDNK